MGALAVFQEQKDQVLDYIKIMCSQAQRVVVLFAFCVFLCRLKRHKNTQYILYITDRYILSIFYD